MRKLLVANRGEIAVRIIASAALAGLDTVAVYTADDRDCAHVARADEAIALPGTGAAGYLDIDAVIAAAVTAGADAIHPGYGFLAESAHFANQCAERLVAFVGPPPQALEAFGDKSRARAIAAGLGIPVPRGTEGPATLDEIRRLLDSLGPGGAVMVKAVAGLAAGGAWPRSPRRPTRTSPRPTTWCAAEARAAFGSAALYAEELIEGARHIEVQVAADTAGTVVALGDRDCSVQRRRQKLIEIAPAPWLDDDMRTRLHAAATALIGAVPYCGLATVEFLVRDSEITFLEVNPRIQVEHTVTEEVTGLDLVALALRLADGSPLSKAGLAEAGLAEAGSAGGRPGGVGQRGAKPRLRRPGPAQRRDRHPRRLRPRGRRPPRPLSAAWRWACGSTRTATRAIRSARATTRCSPRSSPPAPPWRRLSPGCAAHSVSSTSRASRSTQTCCSPSRPTRRCARAGSTPATSMRTSPNWPAVPPRRCPVPEEPRLPRAGTPGAQAPPDRAPAGRDVLRRGRRAARLDAGRRR